ncbi:MAG: right-handed parallel beta-helix repeat-containing protein [Bacteroidetes bacterium]|nr:right-handed parallel beta-helix repeat-containing protein [Bacteroidota bacterium]
MKLLTLLLLSLIISANVYAQNRSKKVYYVSSQGNDKNTGRIKTPFKTIQKAADIMRAGDICYIRQGVYSENISLSFNGTTQAPISFYNYPKDTVVLTANKPVTHWQHYKGNIYKTYFPDSALQVFCNHQESPIASYPNITNKLNADEWADANADRGGNVVLKGKKFPKNYWTGAYCRILTGNKWIAHIGKIESSNDSMVHCTNSLAPFSNMEADVFLGKGKACIVGHLNALDNDHEWVWQHDTLYYYVPASLDINVLAIEARTHVYALDATSRKHIIISGIHFFAASINLKDAEDCIIENGSVQYPAPFYWYGSGFGRQYNYKTVPLATDKWRGKGVYISGRNNLIQNEYIAHSWGDGVSLGGENNTVRNCFIEDCDWSMTDCATISATGYMLHIQNNTCRKAARSIIVHRFANKIEILYNHLYDAGLGTDDLGLTYSYQSNGEGAQIAYNWIHDNHASGTNTGIYLDNQDTAFVVHHNVVWNCKFGIQTNKDAVNHQIYNNTIFNCENPSWAWGPDGTKVIGQKVYNNLSENPIVIGNDFKNNITDKKESLEDINNFDFRLKKGAKAIDAGIEIKGITDNYIGNAPDAGAYEYSTPKWIAGSNINVIGTIFPKER